MNIAQINRTMGLDYERRRAVWEYKNTSVVEGSTSVQEALEKSGMDWLVEQETLINPRTGVQTPYKLNLRNDTNDVLGIVGSKYTPVQNIEAFNFLDELTPLGITFERVGMTDKGNRMWMCVKLNEAKILGDQVDSYVILTNSHDGSGSLKVTTTPMRLACHNCLSWVFKRHSARAQSLRHSPNVQGKMKEAQEVMGIASQYMAALEAEAEELSKIKVAPKDFAILSEQLFPITEEDTLRTIDKQEQARYFLKQAYNEDDLGNHRGTGYGVMNAIADYEQHRASMRNPEKALIGVLDGSSLMRKAHDILLGA